MALHAKNGLLWTVWPLPKHNLALPKRIWPDPKHTARSALANYAKLSYQPIFEMEDKVSRYLTFIMECYY